MTRKQQQPHIGIATLVSGMMAIALALGLQYLKIVDKINQSLEYLLMNPALLGPSNRLSVATVWIGSAMLSLFVAAVMLNVAGTWRRLVIWGFTSILTFSWAPVLLLASYRPEIGVALVAVFWSGFCAMIYATNHELPADLRENQTMRKTNGAR